MFTAIKSWSMAIGVGAIALMALVIKVLFARNKKKSAQIDTLENNIEVQEKVNSLNLERTKFNAKQEVKAEIVNDETALDAIDKKRDTVDETSNDDDWHTITK
jgi:hypothetical protein